MRTCLALMCLGLAGCATAPAPADPELSSLGKHEVTAELLEVPGPFPSNDLYNYAFVLKYRVRQVHRGSVPPGEIFVGHYNPRKPRAAAADEESGKIGGRLEQFRAGDLHRMALEEPLDHHWMGGIIDKYFEQKGTRYWAVWTNPASR